MVVSVAPYGGVARKAVLRVKNQGCVDAANWIASQVVERLRVMAVKIPSAITPIPPHPRRFRQRGFDHAALIATALSRELDVPHRRYLMLREGDDRRSTGSSRQQRIDSQTRLQCLKKRCPEHVLLLDDVYTTGATLGATARALRAGGAKLILGVTFARTLR